MVKAVPWAVMLIIIIIIITTAATIIIINTMLIIVIIVIVIVIIIILITLGVTVAIMPSQHHYLALLSGKQPYQRAPPRLST